MANTSKSTQPPISDEDVKEIRVILQQQFSSLLVRAMSDTTAIKDLQQTIMNAAVFKNTISYHNPEVAKSIVNEVADLGVIDYLLQQHPNITDIGFNGRFLSIETNSEKYTYGNHPGEHPITEGYIKQLINRFALREGAKGKEFGPGRPLFNGFNNNIRISATHRSVSPAGTTLSLRVSKPTLALNKQNFDSFAPNFIYSVLKLFIRAHANIIISGETGTGKTELQKLLIGEIPFEDKIIMIEDVAETHLTEIYPDKDIYSWITSDNGDTQAAGKSGVSISDHVKNALRNNPKWLMISETRGQEAYEMFQAVLSGHNIITTLHSINNEAVPRRFVGMSSLGFNIREDLLEEDFLNYMHIGIHIKKKILNGHVFRYLDELAEFVPKSKEHPNGINVLFNQRIDENGFRHWESYEPTPKIIKLIADELDRNFTISATSNVEKIPDHSKDAQWKKPINQKPQNAKPNNQQQDTQQAQPNQSKKHPSNIFKRQNGGM